MTSTLVLQNTTRPFPVDMEGADDLTVYGILSVSAVYAAGFTGPASGASIVNDQGLIENTATGGYAITTTATAGASLTASVTNSGMLRADAGAIRIDAVTSGTLTLVNDVTGYIVAATGVTIDLGGATGAFVADLTNYGSIVAYGASAVVIGGIVQIANHGGLSVDSGDPLFSPDAHGIYVLAGASGTIENVFTGTNGTVIVGEGNGILAEQGTSLVIVNGEENGGLNSGSIIGANGAGISSRGAATITNYGIIQGRYAGAPESDFNGAGAGGVPDGTPDGDGDGINIDGLAVIDNYGSIGGVGAGGHDANGRANSSEGISAAGGTITNQAGGNIGGVNHGILVDDGALGAGLFLTTIVNAGSISGSDGVGIRLIGGFDDTVDNAGFINGFAAAIQFGSGANVLIVRDGSVMSGIADGGGGVDRLDYSNFGADVSVDLESGTATGTGGVADFAVVTGSTHNDLLLGDALGNLLQGLDGTDQLDGRGGNDTLDGGAGVDTLTGGNGNDTYVNPFGDTIIEAANGGTDTVTTDASFSIELFINVERVFLTGTAAIDATGNGLANQFIGNDKINTLNGRDGNDTINAGGGADTLNGGSGADRLIGGLQRDKIIPGADNVRDDIVFTSIGESTGHTRDVIMGLDLNNEDKLDLPGTVSSIAAARSGALSLATFNNNIVSVFNAAALPVNSAALFTATSGDLVNPNMVYLIVDANGIAGYQANQDWVFQLENHTGTLDTTDFI